MKKKQKFLKLGLCVALSAMLVSGCGTDKAAAPSKENTENVSKENTVKTKEKPAEDTKDALKEENESPKDGVITQEQMESIAGVKGNYKFNGETSDGVKYTWTYDGLKIQNPVEQKLKVELSGDNLDEIKKQADNAPYALQVNLQKMELAAPATLELTLNEKWDADRVLYCIYKDDQIYQLDQAKIEDTKENDQDVSKISFQVSKADGDTYVLLGGSSEGTEDENTADQETDTEENSTEANVQENSDNTSGDDSSDQEDTHTCTISIECSAILDNWDDLKSSKAEFVPSDGWILYPSEVSFNPGDTVFDVLKDACNQAGIQMSSKYTPLYGSYYVEGINQLYEFDCGQNSGWMYSVNGWFPNYGCSSYTVEDGDNIEWKYTCNLGSDVGNGYEG